MAVYRPEHDVKLLRGTDEVHVNQGYQQQLLLLVSK